MNMTYVTPEYFDTLRIPIVRGRAFTDADAPTRRPSIIVNQSFVRRYSADRDPIGRQILSGGATRTIVGISGDVQQKTAFGNFGPVGTPPARSCPRRRSRTAS